VSLFPNPLHYSESNCFYASWRCPSNIAIVKYWGKFGLQLPRNPSLSLTLDKAHTDTTVKVMPRQMTDSSVTVIVDGLKNENFKPKIMAFLKHIEAYLPWTASYDYEIHTHNTFPHGAGIASSASAFGALSLCLLSVEEQMLDNAYAEDEFLKKASFLARIGSGSASRSVYPIAAAWGKLEQLNASDEYAIPCGDRLHKIFHTFHDDILIVSKNEKSVSSTAGHQLMEGNPFASLRYEQAEQRMHDLIHCLALGDIEAFGTLCEEEALSLHALMMLSKPSYLLMEPNSIAIIQKIRNFRAETKLPVYFTLDAGPNIHLLYPDNIASKVREWVDHDLVHFCKDQFYLKDKVGQGPQIIPQI